MDQSKQQRYLNTLPVEERYRLWGLITGLACTSTTFRHIAEVNRTKLPDGENCPEVFTNYSNWSCGGWRYVLSEPDNFDDFRATRQWCEDNEWGWASCGFGFGIKETGKTFVFLCAPYAQLGLSPQAYTVKWIRGVVKLEHGAWDGWVAARNAGQSVEDAIVASHKAAIRAATSTAR